MGTMDTDPVPGERWDDTMRRTMTSIHREFCAHPNMYDIDLDPSASYRGLAAHTRKIVGLHLAQGIPEDVLTKAWAMIDAFLTGFNSNAITTERMRRAISPMASTTTFPHGSGWCAPPIRRSRSKTASR